MREITRYTVCNIYTYNYLNDCIYLSRCVQGSQWLRKDIQFIKWVVSVWALWSESPNPLVIQAPPTPRYHAPSRPRFLRWSLMENRALTELVGVVIHVDIISCTCPLCNQCSFSRHNLNSVDPISTIFWKLRKRPFKKFIYGVVNTEIVAHKLYNNNP